MLSKVKIFICVTFLFFQMMISFSCTSEYIPKKHEIRAVWMTRFEYARDKTASESQEYIKDSFAKLSDAGFNLVVFQIRGTADAFYYSAYEPWSKLLTDTLGQDPGWDPLGYALQTAHDHGLELHAWLNTFPAWKAQKEHVGKRWIKTARLRLFLIPIILPSIGLSVCMAQWPLTLLFSSNISEMASVRD